MLKVRQDRQKREDIIRKKLESQAELKQRRILMAIHNDARNIARMGGKEDSQVYHEIVLGRCTAWNTRKSVENYDGNSLGVSPSLYEALLLTASQTRKELGLTAVASEGEVPADISACPLSGRKVNTHQSMKLITQDLLRTFHKFSFFRDDGPLRELLRQILEASVCFRPDMGYVQGMSFLGAMLLLYMDTYSAFQCLVNLLDQYVYISYVGGDSRKLARLFDFFEEVMKRELPRLSGDFAPRESDARCTS